MAIAQKVAGYSLGKADLLRRAMGKKKKSVLDAEYVGFEAGMKANGFSAAAVKTLWDILVPFADYAFNKAHSAAYGLISYWTAYLKANYPAEYMAGLLTSVGDDKDRRPIYLAECRRMGIKVLPPDVNESSWDFTAVGTDIRFGLASVRNVGHNVVDSIVRAREEKGAFKDFADFMRKIDTVACNKKVIESLAKAGGVRLPRPLPAGHRRGPRPGRRLRDGAQAQGGRGAVRPVRQLRRRRGGADDPFGGALDIVIPTADWSKSERLVFERDMLGLYVSDHPLHGVEHVLTSHADTPIAEINAGGVEDGANVTIAGILTAVSPAHEQAGRALGDRHARGPRVRHRGAVLPQDLGGGLGEGRPRPDRRGQGPDQPARRPALAVRLRGHASPSSPRARAARCWSRCPRPAAPRRSSSGCARCSAATPAPPRCSSSWSTAAARRCCGSTRGCGSGPSTALMGDIKALLGPTSVALL